LPQPVRFTSRKGLLLGSHWFGSDLCVNPSGSLFPDGRSSAWLCMDRRVQNWASWAIFQGAALPAHDSQRHPDRSLQDYRCRCSGQYLFGERRARSLIAPCSTSVRGL